MPPQLSTSLQPLRNGLRSCLVASTSRQGFATSSSCRSTDTPPTSSTASMQETQTQLPSTAGTERAEPASRRGGKGAPAPPPYPEWVKGQGKMYEEAPPGRGPFWIGSTPFPLNPSFDPPPPLSQQQKRRLWHLHTSNESNTVRALSGKFGIPMERVQAVLRLQALEAEWTREGKSLQEPFRSNMERLLGAEEEIKPEDETATVSKNSNPRGPLLEEFPLTMESETYPSVIAPALEAEGKERAARKRTLPTGGPASRGPTPSVATIQSTATRAPLTVVDMSERPASYSGAGVVARNERRAEKKQEYRRKKKGRREEARAAAPSS